MNTAQDEGGRRCKKSTLNDLVHLTPLRIPLMNPPLVILLIVMYVVCISEFIYEPFSLNKFSLVLYYLTILLDCCKIW